MHKSEKIPNRLINERSPYLLQHAENPVDWYSWGEEAFAKAESEDKPIFLSIGYSTCHWCHVMAHESFENLETAEILNKYFVSIKVDREERPDIDSVYMSVCQAFMGSGGWPMSIFMTWDRKPFFAGTYFPPRSHYGMPGFPNLLNTIAERWTSNRSVLLQSADQIISDLKNIDYNRSYSKDVNLIEIAVKSFSDRFDRTYGGFGIAPKFPTPHNLLFLMMYAKLNNNHDALFMTEKTLQQMRKGGIFDHVGFGFSRYSTDKYFLAPHFEKMLYDNALLIIAYSSAYSITNDPIYLDTAKKTAEYILREMTSPDGGFYSAQDADSEGVEGKYYTFTLSEILDILGDDKGKQFADNYDITLEGNFDNKNIPNLLKSNNFNENLDIEKQKLYDFRKVRSKLHLDDKILISWNSMMIAAMSMLYRVSGDDKYINAAIKAKKFIEQNLCQNTQLYTSFREGKHSNNVFLDDYAYYIAALIELYNSTLESNYLEEAERFCKEAVKRYSDCEQGGYYLGENDNFELFMNPKETYDGAIPSGNSVMTYNLVRLFQLTKKDEYQMHVQGHLHFMSMKAHDYPEGHSMFLLAKMIYDNPPEHITIVLKDFSDLSAVLNKLPFLSNISVVTENEEYTLIDNRTTYYVCRNHICLPPINELY